MAQGHAGTNKSWVFALPSHLSEQFGDLLSSYRITQHRSQGASLALLSDRQGLFFSLAPAQTLKAWPAPAASTEPLPIPHWAKAVPGHPHGEGKNPSKIKQQQANRFFPPNSLEEAAQTRWDAECSHWQHLSQVQGMKWSTAIARAEIKHKLNATIQFSPNKGCNKGRKMNSWTQLSWQYSRKISATGPTLTASVWLLLSPVNAALSLLQPSSRMEQSHSSAACGGSRYQRCSL